ncbi:MAG: UDP-glucose 4-epimerase GalE, partial [Mariprofundaceae bacterium]
VQCLQMQEQSRQFNLGNGQGFSVQQVLDICRKVTGRKIAIHDGQRREGDPAVLVADSTFARSELGWKPQYSDLQSIVSHAWQWENR